MGGMAEVPLKGHNGLGGYPSGAPGSSNRKPATGAPPPSRGRRPLPKTRRGVRPGSAIDIGRTSLFSAEDGLEDRAHGNLAAADRDRSAELVVLVDVAARDGLLAPNRR